MSAAIALVIRVLALFGVSLSPFAAGAILAAVAIGAAGVGGLRIYEAGRNAAEIKCEAAALEAQLRATEIDRDASVKALGDARLRTAAVERQASDEQERTAAYVATLEKQAGAACALNDDDLRGMRIVPGDAPAARKRPSGAARLLDAVRPGAAARPQR